MSVSLCTQCGAISKPSFHYTNELETSSLLYNLRTSNFPATDQESSHIQKNILPNIDADISSITAKITSLQQERDALTTVRKTYRGLISPCRAVPRELWEQIFSSVHEDEQIGDEEFTVSDPNCSIWDLTKVCQTWRAVAVSLHSCWTKLHLKFPRDSETEQDVQVLKVALQRSGKHSHRWRNACFTDHHMNSDILYAPLRGRLPMLESLNLGLCGDFHIPMPVEQRSVVTVFNDCLRLTKVVLTGTRPVQLPWGQIRELRLEDNCQLWVVEARRQFVSLIGRCPNLQVLQACCDFEFGENPPPSSTICPSIRVLDTAIDFVMDRLTLPHLQEVILSFSKDLDNSHASTLRSFHRLLQRSRCNLTSLQIRDIPLHHTDDSAHDLYAILSQMAHLAVLDIRVSMKRFDRDEADPQAMAQITKVLDALSVASPDIITFLPCLSSLDIDLKHHRYRSLPYFGPSGRLVPMLKARWEGDDMRGLTKLKRFQFSLSASPWCLEGWQLCSNADEIGGKIELCVFDDEEGRILHDLAMDGMDVAIRVRSVDATRTLSSKVVHKVPGEPSQQEAKDQLLARDPTTY
ncbi:hypothetical protein BDZ89DRAFT_1069857 [Hymenopellis radicata]|nr:hypothetical protein BDZ89DRAFT_1069857 [Hymenopellis radicata]